MPFPQPPTTSITLPSGATTGARIVLDGTTDTITIYDANNVAVITITASVSVGATTGPGLTFSPDTSPSPEPWTQVGYLDTVYNAGLGIGSLRLEAPSLDPAKNNQGRLFLDSGTPGGGGLDSNAELSAGPAGLAQLTAGTVRLDSTTDAYPKAGTAGADHNVVVGEWRSVGVTVASGSSSGTTAISFTDLYSVAPKVLVAINSSSGSAIRATVFAESITAIGCTIRVDTNSVLGSTVTFPIAVLVLP